MEFLEKLKIKLLYDPGIPLLGIYLEKILIQKDTDVHSSTTHKDCLGGPVVKTLHFHCRGHGSQ